MFAGRIILSTVDWRALRIDDSTSNPVSTHPELLFGRMANGSRAAQLADEAVAMDRPAALPFLLLKAALDELVADMKRGKSPPAVERKLKALFVKAEPRHVFDNLSLTWGS